MNIFNNTKRNKITEPQNFARLDLKSIKIWTFWENFKIYIRKSQWKLIFYPFTIRSSLTLAIFTALENRQHHFTTTVFRFRWIFPLPLRASLINNIFNLCHVFWWTKISCICKMSCANVLMKKYWRMNIGWETSGHTFSHE